ncbi:hypothetical protein PFISCL1PPCAC_27530, partial [Pristionchus fissidentatus]
MYMSQRAHVNDINDKVVGTEKVRTRTGPIQLIKLRKAANKRYICAQSTDPQNLLFVCVEQERVCLNGMAEEGRDDVVDVDGVDVLEALAEDTVHLLATESIHLQEVVVLHATVVDLCVVSELGECV